MTDAMLAMNDEIVPELAWQMGRPVRFGAGEMRGFEERARYMIGIAEDVLQPIDPGPKERLQALHHARAARHRADDRAVELPLHDRRQLGRPGADGRQRRDPEARRADAARRRALPDGGRPGRPAGGPVPAPLPRPRADRPHPDGRHGRPPRLHRLGRRRPRDGGGGGRHLHLDGPRARRQGSGLCPGRLRPRSHRRERRRRRLLQLRPVLLRRRAHLRPPRRLRRVPRRLRRDGEGLQARRSAGRGDDARAHGAAGFGRHGARPDRGRAAGRREGAYRHESLRARGAGLAPTWRRRCSRR